MNTDKTVQNQKVFVRLSAVLQLQSQYKKILAYQGTATGDAENDCRVAERQAFEKVIQILELPIEVEDSIPNYSTVVREVPK